MFIKMKHHHQDIFICLILLGTGGSIFMLTSALGNKHDLEKSWLLRLLYNNCGYSIIFVPGYFIIKYIRKVNYDSKHQKGFLWSVIKICVYGGDMDQLPSLAADKNKKDSSSENEGFLLLLYCFGGLQISYLLWGLLQEKIMTVSYGGQNFKDSQFVVFVNRILGMSFACIYLSVYENGFWHVSARTVPLYKYSYCALSNTLSAWLQYEALKFVSFPAQVLAKACKIIPVMLMGKVVSKASYEFYEYLTAVLISIGMILFLSGSSDFVRDSTPSGMSTGISGVIILLCYMILDSFTSNWQNQLFISYKVSSVRMMAGVNLFSCLLTGISLFQQGSFIESLKFMSQHHSFVWDCVIFSICSAVGQLFIYYTIEKFGAVIFVTIMTIRQALAILLSCILYRHPISGVGVVGVCIVFLSLFIRTYCNYRIKQIRNKNATSRTCDQVSKV